MKPVKASQPLTRSERQSGSCSNDRPLPDRWPTQTLERRFCAGAGRLGALRRLGNDRSLALILRTAKAEDQEENKRQQKQTDPEARSFSKVLCHINAKNYPDDEIHQRNEHKDEPPTGSTRDLDQKIGVHNRDDSCPAWMSGF